jgi:hypothetical protein
VTRCMTGITFYPLVEYRENLLQCIICDATEELTGGRADVFIDDEPLVVDTADGQVCALSREYGRRQCDCQTGRLHDREVCMWRQITYTVLLAKGAWLV